MSDVDNLYKAPEKLDDISTGIEGAPGVNPKTRMFIGQSAPWLKFLGVMGYIGAGVMVLYAIVAFVTPLSLLGYGSNDSGGIGAILALVYLGAAVVMFFSARFMYVMGRSANSFKLLGQAPHL